MKKEFLKQQMKHFSELLNKILAYALVIILVAGAAYLGFSMYSKKKENDRNKTLADAYRTLQEAKNNMKNTSTFATIEEDEIEREKKELAEAKEYLSELGSILLFKRDTTITHSETLNDEGKKAVITMKPKADYWDYLDHQDAEFSVSEDGKKYYLDIPRIKIDPENVYIDTNQKMEVLNHPEPGLITTGEGKPKGKLDKWLKRHIFNDNANSKTTVEDVFRLEQQFFKNARTAAYNQVTEKLMSDDAYRKNLEDIALSVVSNIYNPDIKGHTVTNKDGEVIEAHLPLSKPVVVRFKDA